MKSGKYSLSYTDGEYNIVPPEEAMFAHVDVLHPNGEIHYCVCEILLRTEEGDVIATLDEANKVLALYQILAEDPSSRIKMIRLKRNASSISLKDAIECIDNPLTGGKMRDILQRLKSEQFTDGLLIEAVRELGRPSSVQNLHDQMLNIAACTTKMAACFWFSSDIESLMADSRFSKAATMFSASDEPYSETLFDSILEELK